MPITQASFTFLATVLCLKTADLGFELTSRACKCKN